jgi:hypothetical protein
MTWMTVDELKARRSAMADDDTMAILLSDLIERRVGGDQEAKDQALLADCRTDVARAGTVEVVTLTYLRTGMKVAAPTVAEALVALRKAISTAAEHRVTVTYEPAEVPR